MMGLPGGIAALSGGIIGAILGCVPGFHLIFLLTVAVQISDLAPDIPLWPWCMGLATGFGVSNGVAAAIFSAPDENRAFAVSPTSMLCRRGQAEEAVFWMAAGTLTSVMLMALLAPAIATLLSPPARALSAYGHVLPWAVMALMLTHLTLGRTSRPRPSCIVAGLAATGLCGCIGLILLKQGPLDTLALGRTFAPALVGFFTIPPLILAAPPSGPGGRPGHSTAASSTASRRRAQRRLLTQSATLQPVLSGCTIALIGFHGPTTELLAPGQGRTILLTLILSAGVSYLCLPTLTRRLQKALPPAGVPKGPVAALASLMVFAFCGLPGICTMLAASGVGLMLKTVTSTPLPGIALIVAPWIWYAGGH